MSKSDEAGANLDFGLSRRAFFRALVLEMRDAAAGLHGKRSFALWALQDLPDEHLARLIPVIQPTMAIYLEDERILARDRKTGKVLDLAPASAENVLTLNLFDGRRTLGSASRRLAREMAWDEETAFHHARGLFLSLVGRLVCLPLNTPEAGE